LVRKTAEERARKFINKFNPEIIRQRFIVAKEDIREKYPRTVSRLQAVESVVAEILDRYGITAGTRATYYSFGRLLQKRLYNTSVNFWEREIEGVKQRFKISYGLDEKILDEIARGTQHVISLILMMEGRVFLSEEELQKIKERGKRYFEELARAMRAEGSSEK